MRTQEVAEKLVTFCRQGQHAQAYDELFHSDAIAQEPENFPNNRTQGLENLKAKSQQWGQDLKEMHSMEISDPVVADNFFSCSMKMDITTHSRGRQQMEEVCMYEVNDGKIVKEQFFFSMPG